jgi:hypothetical protein
MTLPLIADSTTLQSSITSGCRWLLARQFSVEFPDAASPSRSFVREPPHFNNELSKIPEFRGRVALVIEATECDEHRLDCVVRVVERVENIERVFESGLQCGECCGECWIAQGFASCCRYAVSFVQRLPQKLRIVLEFRGVACRPSRVSGGGRARTPRQLPPLSRSVVRARRGFVAVSRSVPGPSNGSPEWAMSHPAGARRVDHGR